MTSYRILKLRSGEDIITRICGKKKEKYILDRPMQMKISTFMDPNDENGERTDVLLLRDWLQFTTHNTIEIPIDWIATILTPDKQAIDSYDEAKEREDCGPEDKDEQEQYENNMLQNNNNMIEPGSIIVTLAIPPMIFFHMLSQGLLNGNGYGIEHEEDLGTGNNYRDWPSNIEDYFEDED